MSYRRVLVIRAPYFTDTFATNLVTMRPLALLLVPVLTLSAQTLVGTTPQNRTALLEEFTAINFGFFPKGHVIGADLIAANPDQVVALGLAGGGLSVPGAGQPDFRTTESLPLWSH